MLVRHILENLNLGNSVAEFDQNLDKYFIRNAAFRNLITDQSDLIAGDKGTGKSAIYKYLASQYTNMHQLESIEIVPGFNPAGTPMFNSLKLIGDMNEQAYIIVWKTYIFSLLGNWILDLTEGHSSSKLAELEELLSQKLGLRSQNEKPERIFAKLIGWTRKHLIPSAIGIESTIDEIGKPVIIPKIEFATAVETAPESAQEIFIPDDSCLQLLDDVLAEQQIKIWLLLDRLDEAFISLPDIEKPALRSLLRTYLDLQLFENFKIKLFIRKDLFRKIVSGGFVNLTHVTARRTEITWYKEDLKAMLCERVRQSEKFMKYIATKPITDAKLFDTLFPKRAGKSANQPLTWRWMLSHLRDGNNVHSPRNLIDLVKYAVEEQINREYRHNREYDANKPLIETQSLRLASRRLSEARVVDTLMAEVDPEVGVLIEALKNGKSEHNLGSLQELLGVSNESYVLSYASALKDIGLFERKDNRFIIPPLYRFGLNVRRGKAF